MNIGDHVTHNVTGANGIVKRINGSIVTVSRINEDKTKRINGRYEYPVFVSRISNLTVDALVAE